MSAASGLDLEPGVSQRFGKVVVHRTRDGHRVKGGLGFLVVLAEAAAEVLLDHRVALWVCVGPSLISRGPGGAAVHVAV